MVSSILRNVLKPRCRRAVTLTLACVLGFGTTGFAQDIELLPSPSSVRAALARPVPDDTVDTRGVDLLKVIADTNGHEPLVRPAPRGARSQRRLSPPAASHRGSRARRVTGAVIGAIGGFWIGAELGAALEGDSCMCDDPGMAGFLFGSSVGAAAGAVLGALLAGR